ncbi:hypothetical protein [Ralstonia holmesii]|uniref:hypothetical protein n=1 Tax=Ralstonia holmesii TaxID=3058602 RepID=UPI0028F56431|nr:hypothetical protein [Ralstonia sp. LMG 32967]CAJ0698705.1 hypothetical protein R11007_02864 [Ralstonia sp. LMG 32967]
MNAPAKREPAREHLEELLHRMTVADTRDVRLQLCAEAKRELDKLLRRLDVPAERG